VKRKYFVKKLIRSFFSYLVPVTFVTMVFSLLLVHKTKEEILKKVPVMVENLKTSIETSFETTGHISVMLDNHPNIKLSVSKMLNSTKISYADLSGFHLLCSLVDTPADDNVFIDSVYVYLVNDNENFIVSGLGIQSFNSYPDTQWYNNYLNLENSQKLFIEKRAVKSYQFEQTPTPIVSLYKPVSGGVVVTNFHAGYFNNLLRHYQTFDDELLFIANLSGDVLLKNQNIDPELLKQITDEKPVQLNEIIYNNRTYIIHSYLSEQYNLFFVSIVPEDDILYLLAKQILKIIFYVVLLSFVLAFLTAYSQVRRNFTQLQSIIDVFGNAEKGLITDGFVCNENDEYSLILNNIVQVFITQSYLKMQLSERIYKQKVAELTALQLQINPHFLFNTLQTISFEVGKHFNGEIPAQATIQNLASLLKYSMQNFNTPVTLSEEIHYAKVYCDIQKFRYEDKFKVFWEYSNDCLEISFSRMIFQPLIENSLIHGINQKDGVGLIKIKITKASNSLKIRVIDNGIGIDNTKLVTILNKLEESEVPLNEKNIGLSNTNQRLVLKYGEESKLHIRSKKGLGTVVWFSIPYN
jgi:two-component system sensor histidine kinase YesM